MIPPVPKKVRVSSIISAGLLFLWVIPPVVSDREFAAWFWVSWMLLLPISIVAGVVGVVRATSHRRIALVFALPALLVLAVALTGFVYILFTGWQE
jgi:hypothetical protein